MAHLLDTTKHRHMGDNIPFNSHLTEDRRHQGDTCHQMGHTWDGRVSNHLHHMEDLGLDGLKGRVLLRRWECTDKEGLLLLAWIEAIGIDIEVVVLRHLNLLRRRGGILRRGTTLLRGQKVPNKRGIIGDINGRNTNGEEVHHLHMLGSKGAHLCNNQVRVHLPLSHSICKGQKCGKAGVIWLRLYGHREGHQTRCRVA